MGGGSKEILSKDTKFQLCKMNGFWSSNAQHGDDS